MIPHKEILGKILEWLLKLLAPSLLLAYLYFEVQIVNTLSQMPITYLFRTLIGLLLLSVILGSLLFLKRSKYTEHRGAYFKPKKGGGYHQAVYCGSCKTPTSYEGEIPINDKKFKCKCGWVSSFNLGEFGVFYPTL